jgi:subfamily B ATP-binding cassette protein MsbA
MEKINSEDSSLKRLLRYTWPYKGFLFLSFMGASVVAATDAALAKLVQPFIDDIIVSENYDYVKYIPVFVLSLGVVKGLSRYLQEYFIRLAGLKAVIDIRTQLFKHVMSMSMRFFHQRSIGSLMSNVFNDTIVLQHAFSNVLLSVMRESLVLIGLIIVAFYSDWQMALTAFVVLPVVGYAASLIGKRIKKYGSRSQEATAQLTKAVEQSLSGIKVVKSFGTESRESSRFTVEIGWFYKYFRKVIAYTVFQGPINEIITSIGVAAVLWFAMQRVIAGELTQGTLFSVLAAVVMMYNPAKRLSRVYGNTQQALAAAERVFEVLDISADVEDEIDAVPLVLEKGQISFDNVTFAYDSSPVLSDFTLDIKPGQVIALVGPSGAGKSTVAALLARFYDPQQGSVLVDGQDIRSVERSSLLEVISFVDQEAFLFNETIRFNICYGCVDATPEQIQKASEQAYINDFINDLPDKYDTVIGDRGSRLSGGQRQRICIARAILRNTPVLVLDEATSALDTESEAIVQSAMQNLMLGRTTIVIAHRLSTIMNADRIIVMEAGRISESGTHVQLLKQGGLYKKLYDMQFKDAE